MFQPPSRSHHQGVQKTLRVTKPMWWSVKMLLCCYVYAFTSRCDCCGMLSIPQQSHRNINTNT